ncbi:MAG: hypothetical protein V3R80_02420, partial [Candidatus Tectomicrobia bacterium]
RNQLSFTPGGEGHRALRAPASPSVPSACSQAPGAKTGSGSLRLSRHWLPQLPALLAAAAGLDDAGSTGGLASPTPSLTTPPAAALHATPRGRSYCLPEVC